MLFGYPIEATEENWFHEGLISVIITINNSVFTNQPKPIWIEAFPEEFREGITGHGAFGTIIDEYYRIARTLTKLELDQISETLNQQNRISELLANRCSCLPIDSVPISLRPTIIELFDFGFDQLIKRLGIRDRQYKKIYESIPSSICPFCGLEYFTKPGIPREDLDHFLLQNKYTFAATNLFNLVPMGHKCNSLHKNQQDILFTPTGIRRLAFNPYQTNGVQVSLLNSNPFNEDDNDIDYPLPKWQVDFSPNSTEVETWDCVFKIRQRFIDDVLEDKYIKWLREFGIWCKKNRPVENLIPFLTEYTEQQIEFNKNDMGNQMFLKAAVFEMLLYHCLIGEQRLIDFLLKVANGVA